jgi:hypothetical protein
VLNPVGKALTYGHEHPFESFMNVVGAPDRALHAYQVSSTPGDIPYAFMHPETAPILDRAVKHKIGLDKLESGALAGSDLLHKFARGTLNTLLDSFNSPYAAIPADAPAAAAKLIPGLAKAGAAAKATKVGKVLDAEAPLSDLTPKGKATFQAIQNRAADASRAVQQREEAVVKKYADQIRAGHMPPEVAALFRDPKKIPALVKGTRPQDVISALVRDRGGLRPAQMNRDLRNAGLIAPPKLTKNATEAQRLAPRPKPQSEFFRDPSKIAAAQKTLGQVANPRGSSRAKMTIDNIVKNPRLAAQIPGAVARGVTRQGNKAFLAIPVPHGANLTNLAFNEYGLPTTLRGLGAAARVATGTVGKGKLAQNIGELEQLGAKSQYHNIFDELGISRVAGIPGSEGVARTINRGIVPLERASNWAQNHFLNPLETGLRSAALDVEKKKGISPVEAARNIHSTFGSNRPNLLVRAGEGTGAQFAKFHFQTAPRSFAKTLANNPNRIVAPLKADRDENAQINPGGSTKFHLSTPTFSGVRMAVDPEHYITSLFGPIGALASQYSSLSQLQKGKVAAALSTALGRYIPADQGLAGLYEVAAHKKGQAGEAGTSDLMRSLTGGYFQRPK